MPPDPLFMNPLAGEAPLLSPASRETVAPPAVFTAPPAPEGFDEASSEPEIPFRPQPSRKQPPGQRRAGQRTSGQGRNHGRGNGRDQRTN
ncbi:hypothetical protein GCM10023081_40260 [Arthrobacter ginkgonis]|uniref:Uncharacterized protein n=1 Tax=Arthrobacter ginkgonis TaxID=1630594 RepID=A0ABP7D182_9MICC